MPTAADDPASEGSGEDAFLFGWLGNALGPLRLGIDLRPSRLRTSFAGTSIDRNLLITADVTASYRVNGWTVYGEAGRKLRGDEAELDSHEYWVGRLPDEGLGFRAGRFLPAYGVKLADHTSFNRVHLGLTQYAQVYGLEFSATGSRYLVQTSIGPGFADAIIDDDGRQGLTATGRVQVDLGPRTVVVGSGLYRDESREAPRQTSTGLAVGFALPRLAVWTQVDGVFEGDAAEPSYVLTNETSFEVVRGLWLKASPQAILGDGDRVPDRIRLNLGLVFLPRTHWNVNVAYYRDHDRTSRTTAHVVLTQLHLYL